MACYHQALVAGSAPGIVPSPDRPHPPALRPASTRPPDYYEAACELQPDDPRVHADLGGLLSPRGTMTGRRVHYLAALNA